MSRQAKLVVVSRGAEDRVNLIVQGEKKTEGGSHFQDSRSYEQGRLKSFEASWKIAR